LRHNIAITALFLGIHRSLLRVADTYFSQELVSAAAMVRNPRPTAAHHLDCHVITATPAHDICVDGQTGNIGGFMGGAHAGFPQPPEE